jgi:hypothetical protein
MLSPFSMAKRTTPRVDGSIPSLTTISLYLSVAHCFKIQSKDLQKDCLANTLR